jgi:hypothetical protein
MTLVGWSAPTASGYVKARCAQEGQVMSSGMIRSVKVE